MSTITLPPALPPFAAGQVASSTYLSNLVAAVNFLNARPLCQVVATTGGRSISSSGNTSAIEWDSYNFDNSGMFSSANPDYVTIQTPGWYKVRYSIVVNTEGGGVFNGYATTLASGVTSSNYIASTGDSATSVPVCAFGASGLWPFYLATGTKLTLWVQSSVSGSVTDVTPCGSMMSLEYVSI